MFKSCTLSSNYYRPKRSYGKVMFLHVSVILFGGGGDVSVLACTTGHMTRGVCPGGLCPGGVSVQAGSLSRGVSVQGVSVRGSLSGGGLCLGGLCLGGPVRGEFSVRETPRTVTSGRYATASYWNAFLFN